MLPWSYPYNNLMEPAWYKPSKETPSPQNFLGSGRQLRSTVTHHVPPTTVTLVTFHCIVKYCTTSYVNFLCTRNGFDKTHLDKHILNLQQIRLLSRGVGECGGVSWQYPKLIKNPDLGGAGEIMAALHWSQLEVKEARGSGRALASPWFIGWSHCM